MKISTIIVAAGSGTRFGAEIPKQFVRLNGKPILMHTIEKFRRAFGQNDIEESIVVVLSRDHIHLWRELCEKYSFDSPTIALGGETRANSVFNALTALPRPVENEVILVHDGARPLVSTELINRVAATAAKKGSAIPVIPVTDTLRHFKGSVKNNCDSQVVDRSQYCLVQTPQGFLRETIEQAYRTILNSGLGQFTDDASVFEAATGASACLTDGETANIKITGPTDIHIASVIDESASKY